MRGFSGKMLTHKIIETTNQAQFIKTKPLSFKLEREAVWY
jgi:hypothetical protein